MAIGYWQDTPCGYMTTNHDGTILECNACLLELLQCERDGLVGSSVRTILTASSRIFYGLYVTSLLQMQERVEEIHLSLAARDGAEIPVLVNAKRWCGGRDGEAVTHWVLFPVRKRNEFEEELLKAKRVAEEALLTREKALLEIGRYQERMEKELRLAKSIQENSLQRTIYSDRVEVLPFFRASEALSGDMYDFYRISDSVYAFLILDVMGHGITSALLSMSLRSFMGGLVAKGMEIEAMLGEMNRHLWRLLKQNGSSHFYCTALYLTVDFDLRELRYVNAGHPAGVWQGRDGSRTELVSTSVPLGILEDAQYPSQTYPFNDAGRLMLYTDGVVDAMGWEAFQQLTEELVQAPLEVVQRQVLLRLDPIRKGGSPPVPEDDQCLILIDLKLERFNDHAAK